MVRPLEPQIVEVPPAQGVNEGLGKYVPWTGFHQLRDVVFERTGEIRKRPGYGLLPGALLSGGSLPPIDRVATCGDELLAIGDSGSTANPGATLYSYSETLSQWADKGAVSGLSVTDRRVLARPSNDGLDSAPQVARIGNLELALYQSTSRHHIRVTDLTTGAIVLGQSLAAITGIVKVVLLVTGSVWRFVFVDGLNLKTFTLPPSTLVMSSVTTVGAVASAPLYWDAAAAPNGTLQWAYAGVGIAGTSIEVKALVGSGLITTVAAAGLAGVTRCALAYRTNILLAYDSVVVISGVGGIYARTYAPLTLATVVAPWLALDKVYWTTLHALACAEAPDGTLCVASTTTWDPGISGLTFLSTNEPYRSHFNVFDAAGVPLATAPLIGERPEYLWHVALGSRPFSLGETLYCLVHSRPDAREVDTAGLGTTDESRRFGYALVNLTRRHDGWNPDSAPMLIEGVLAPPDARGLAMSVVGAHLTLPTAPGSTATCPITVYRGGDDTTASETAVADACDVALNPAAEPLGTTAEALGLLVQGGAWPSLYDGRGAVEMAFLQPPGCFLWTLDAGAGPPVPPTGKFTFTYYFLYRWRDDRGLVHLSRRSDPLTVEISAGNVSGNTTSRTVTMTLATTALSRRHDPSLATAREVEIVVYRSKADAIGSHYEVRSTTTVLPLLNRAGLPAVTFIDDVSDDNLTDPNLGSRPQLYTDGGVLDNEVPPPLRHLSAHGGRLWGTSAERNEVWFSKYLIDGEAPGWSIVNRITLDDASGKVVGSAAIDGARVLLTTDQIYSVQGPGPNDTGSPSFDPPARVQASGGCIDARTIVPYRNGVAFLAPNNLMLLDRGYGLQEIGRPVEATVAATVAAALAVAGNITGGLLDPARDRLTFFFEGDGKGVAAVFDVHLDAWTTWEFEATDVRSQALWRGQHILALGGIPAAEGYGTTPAYDGSGQWVSSVIETPWLRPGALGGYARCTRFLLSLERVSAYELQVEVFVDGATTAAQTQTWTEAQLDALATTPEQPLVVSVVPQKAATFKVRLTDLSPSLAPPTGPRAGFVYHGMTLRIGTKPGLYKGPQTNHR